jgi:ferredoxin
MLQITVVDNATGRSRRFDATADEPLLDQLQRECPFSIPNLCWMGACGTCALRVRHGIEHLDRDAFGIGATIETEPGFILPCSASASETAVELGDRFHVTLEVG